MEASVTFSIMLKSKPVRLRPSNAKLRKELRDKRTSKKRRMELWSFLQYRKQHTYGR